jgi:hypothetical protein
MLGLIHPTDQCYNSVLDVTRNSSPHVVERAEHKTTTLEKGKMLSNASYSP